MVQPCPSSWTSAPATLTNPWAPLAAVQKLTYQLAEDAQTITPQKVVEFIDYFDKVANLTGQGVDVQYFKDQAGSVANWIRTKG